jgi:hypothetical protein
LILAGIAATLVNPGAYADNRIHDSYRWLRAINPVGIARPENFDPFWVVTRHAHIQAINKYRALTQAYFVNGPKKLPIRFGVS